VALTWNKTVVKEAVEDIVRTKDGFYARNRNAMQAL
jgi:hypothetical protein